MRSREDILVRIVDDGWGRFSVGFVGSIDVLAVWLCWGCVWAPTLERGFVMILLLGVVDFVDDDWLVGMESVLEPGFGMLGLLVGSLGRLGSGGVAQDSKSGTSCCSGDNISFGTALPRLSPAPPSPSLPILGGVLRNNDSLSEGRPCIKGSTIRFFVK